MISSPRIKLRDQKPISAMTIEELLTELAYESKKNRKSVAYCLCLLNLEKQLLGPEVVGEKDALEKIKKIYPEYFL